MVNMQPLLPSGRKAAHRATVVLGVQHRELIRHADAVALCLSSTARALFECLRPKLLNMSEIVAVARLLTLRRGLVALPAHTIRVMLPLRMAAIDALVSRDTPTTMTSRHFRPSTFACFREKRLL